MAVPQASGSTEKVNWLFSIKTKMAALASVLVLVTAVLLFLIVQRIVVERIVDHEITDLSDETNLACQGVLNDVGQLRMQLFELAQSSQTLEEWRVAARKLLTDRRRYLKTEFTIEGEPSEVVLQDEVLGVGQGIEPKLSKVVKSTMRTTDIHVVDVRFPAPKDLKAKVSIPSTSGPRLVVTADYPIATTDGTSARVSLTLDLVSLNRLTQSPRHLLFVVDSKEKLLTGPPHFTNGKRSAALSQLPRQISAFKKGLDELNKKDEEVAPNEEDEAEQRRGMTLKGPDNDGERLPGYEFVHAFTSDLKHVTGYEDAIATLREKFPDCGISMPTKSAVRLKFRCPSRDRLQELWAELKSLVKGQPVANELALKDTVDCSNFYVHFARLDYDPFQKDRYADVIVAASREEFSADVKAEFGILWFYGAVLVLGGLVSAILLSRLITRPLKRMIASTDRLASGDEHIDLPLADASEIGVLARSFDHMLATIRERTTQLQEQSQLLLEQKARVNAIVERAAEGIITCDKDTHIVEINRAAEKIFGYTPAELIGQRFDKLIDREEESLNLDAKLETATPSEQSLLFSFSLVQEGSSETYGQRKDGSAFPMEVSASRVEVGPQVLYTGIVRDITERKRTELEILDLNKNLERKVKSRTAELQQSNADLEMRTRELRRTNGDLEAARDQALDASRAKSSFLAQMSHELRTPLNGIIGRTELVLEDAEDELAEDLQKVLDNARHLLGLINDILDISKIEADKLKLEVTAFAVEPFVESMASTIDPLAAKNGNRLEIVCEPGLGEMHSDVTRVKQVLLNMLSNACKFTHNGVVTLRTLKKQHEGVEWFRFEVQDSGIGIPEDKLKDLFQPFTQADASTTRKYGGTGLGLAISRKLCRLMGGDVTVVSEIGKGSTFIVQLPAVVNQTETNPEQLAKDLPVAEGTVLVIDDDPSVRDLMQRYLSREGFQVVTAVNGEEGLRFARELQPAVITLDVMMPEMDGWTVLTALKGDPATHDIPVVMATIVDDQNLGYALGATDYLAKPFSRDRLLAVVNRFVHPSSEGQTVLIVEDDGDTRDILKRTLQSAGWQVAEAENGRVGLEQLAECHPRLILLDLMMPEMNGFEFVEELRSNPDWHSIPVLIVTARELSADERAVLSGRVQQILEKGSYTREGLLQRVRDLIIKKPAVKASQAT